MMETGLDERADVVVVGGGIVGLCAAYYLNRDGHSVTLLDAEEEGRASDGNAGMIVPSHVLPLAAPGVIAQGVRWLFNAESPFYIKPRLDLDLLWWLWQFRSNCTIDHVLQCIPILRDLSLASVDLLEEIASAIDDPTGYANTGLLMLYHSEKGMKDNVGSAALAEEAGLDVSRLDRDAVRRLDPQIRTPFEGAVLYHQDGCVDPDALLSALKSHLRKEGVAVRSGVTVDQLHRHERRIVGVRTSEGKIGASEVVLAAGAWSKRLARSLGLRIPVQPAKGYSITVPSDDSSPRIPHILTEEKLTVTPMPGRVRFGGTLSLSGFDGSVDARRTMPLRRLVQIYQGDAAAKAARVWFGYRPCSPDGLPIIGRAPSFENLTIATGHGMMGVTLAPITGKLMAEIIAGASPSVDLEPVSLERFS